jgi:ABC-2 type transport system permease protein
MMRRVYLVLRHELLTTLRRPSFLIVVFGIPLLATLIFAGVTIFKNAFRGSSDLSPEAPRPAELEVEGYIDQAGLISVIPEDIPASHLVAYPDEEQALEALEAGEITGYYIVPEDYVETGELVYVHPNPSPFPKLRKDWPVRWTLLVNMLGGDAELAGKVWNPVNLQVTNVAAQQHDSYVNEACTSPGMACESNLLIRYLPMIMLVLFAVFMATGSGLLLRSVSGEKQNRVMEILVLSVSPRQMLAGKIAGLGIAGLLQLLTWIGTGYVLLRLGGGMLNLPEGFALPPWLVLWALVFFLLGYGVYASLMAGAGSLVPNMKESGQVMWVVMMPILVSYMLGLLMIEDPHGLLATGLSLFPLTSPIVMMMRLTIGGVPLWQPPLAAGLLALTAILVVRAVAGMFHAQNLLSGQPFSVRRFYSALLGRA